MAERNGMIGMGTPSPAYKLDVSGTGIFPATKPITRIEKLLLGIIMASLKKMGYSYTIDKGINVNVHNSCEPNGRLIIYRSGNVGIGA